MSTRDADSVTGMPKGAREEEYESFVDPISGAEPLLDFRKDRWRSPATFPSRLKFEPRSS